MTSQITCDITTALLKYGKYIEKLKLAAQAVYVEITILASYPGHVGGGKSGLVSTVCACAKNPMISWGIVYHRLRTVNLYRIGPKHVRLELIPQTAGKSLKGLR